MSAYLIVRNVKQKQFRSAKEAEDIAKELLYKYIPGLYDADTDNDDETDRSEVNTGKKYFVVKIVAEIQTIPEVHKIEDY